MSEKREISKGPWGTTFRTWIARVRGHQGGIYYAETSGKCGYCISASSDRCSSCLISKEVCDYRAGSGDTIYGKWTQAKRVKNMLY
jgi:hypothetical protein